MSVSYVYRTTGTRPLRTTARSALPCTDHPTSSLDALTFSTMIPDERLLLTDKPHFLSSVILIYASTHSRLHYLIKRWRIQTRQPPSYSIL